MRLFILLLCPYLSGAIGLNEQEGDCDPVIKRVHNGKIVYSSEPTNGKFRLNATARVKCDEGYVTDVTRFQLYDEVTCELYDESYGEFLWLPHQSAMVDCKPGMLTLFTNHSDNARRASRRTRRGLRRDTEKNSQWKDCVLPGTHERNISAKHTARVECDDGYVSDGKFYVEVTCELYFSGEFIWLPADFAMVDCKPGIRCSSALTQFHN